MLNWFASEWWIQCAGLQLEQWARIECDGKLAIYDPDGKIIRKARYPSRLKTKKALKTQGFRRLSRREAKQLQPPQVRDRMQRTERISTTH